MQSDGKLSFGANNGSQQSLVSNGAYNDGQWHHLVATQGPTGMRLWVDTALVGSNTVSGAASYLGHWRVGGDRTWGNTLSNYIAGTLDEVAIYPRVLAEQDIRDHYAASGRAANNRPPTASFIATVDDLEVRVDGRASDDPDGPVTHAWDFGDGTVGTGPIATHVYAASGTYTVRLTVSDGPGLTAAATRTVTVVANQPPTAAFTTGIDDLALAVDATGSSDADGTIEGYAWDFGDGTSGSGAADTHTYAASGTYDVKLIVTDDDGAKSVLSKSVTVTEPPNAGPDAVFTSAVDDLVVATDADGTIEGYAWDFGDEASGTGRTPSHTYAASGTYTVELTVTDDQGGTDTVRRDVTVTAPTVLGRDAFGRTATGGWGTADLGGAWTIPTGTSRYSVAGGVGRVSLTAGAGTTANLGSVSATNAETRVSVSLDKAATGGGQYVSVIGRSIGTTGSYQAKVRVLSTGAVSLSLVKVVAGTETALSTTTVPGLTYTAGDSLRLRFQVTGTTPTTLRAKVWKATASEPTGWTSSSSDSAGALQTAGSVGLYSYLSGSATNAPVVVSYDEFWAGAPE